MVFKKTDWSEVKGMKTEETPFSTSLRSAIDLGTNTCLLLVAEWDSKTQCVTRIHEDHSIVVRLGQEVDRLRKLHPEAMARTLACLETYAGRVRAAGLDPAQTVCVCTSQARDASDSAVFFEEVRRKTGFSFRTLSGEQEAELTFRGGLLPGMSPADWVVIDIGGGSTEFRSASAGRSLDIGSVRFTERYLKSDPVLDSEFWACEEAIDRELVALSPWRSGLAPGTGLLAVAGTATTLAAWHLGLREFDATAIDSVTLTRGDVHRMVEELKWRTVAERIQLPGVSPGRADVLLAGALILWRTLETLGFRECRVSTRGLRFGAVGLSESP
jgi:exopolyphosphatase/guanosine-5'-triphosphate,3'-diphosphate pyrophosphatase